MGHGNQEGAMIEIDVGFTKLMAQTFDEGNGVKGILIGMHDADGHWQDLAVFEVDTNDKTKEVIALLWADKDDEDYTQKTRIGQYEAPAE